MQNPQVNGVVMIDKDFPVQELQDLGDDYLVGYA